jgi:nitrogen regulatory protein P-II 1
VDHHLITCIVERGRAERVADEALRAGAQGVTICPARGKGVRERIGMLGHLIDPEKEVIFVVSRSTHTPEIFDAMIKTARIDQPAKGFAFVQAVERVAGYLDGFFSPGPDGGSRRVKRPAASRRRAAVTRKRRR